MTTHLLACKRCNRIHVTTERLELGCKPWPHRSSREGRPALLWAGGSARLPGIPATIMRRLMLVPRGVVPYREMVTWVYGDDPTGGPNNAAGSLSVHLCRLRGILARARFPGEIRTHGNHGLELIVSQPAAQQEIAA